MLVLAFWSVQHMIAFNTQDTMDKFWPFFKHVLSYIKFKVLFLRGFFCK